MNLCKNIWLRLVMKSKPYLSTFTHIYPYTMMRIKTPAGFSIPTTPKSEKSEKAIDSDPIALFGATVAFSKEISPILARKLIEFQIDTIVAPEFSEETIRVLNKHPNIKAIQINTPLEKIQNFTDEEIKLKILL